MQKRLEATITGRVQMVMFRDFAQRRARSLRLVGSVQNMPDKSVRVVAEGEAVDLENFLSLLQKGPVFAKVENINSRWLPTTGEFRDFTIVY